MKKIKVILGDKVWEKTLGEGVMEPEPQAQPVLLVNPVVPEAQSQPQPLLLVNPVPVVYHTGEVFHCCVFLTDVKVDVRGYYPAYPGSNVLDWGAWWEDPGQWEYPQCSRSPLGFHWDDYARYFRELEVFNSLLVDAGSCSYISGDELH